MQNPKRLGWNSPSTCQDTRSVLCLVISRNISWPGAVTSPCFQRLPGNVTVTTTPDDNNPPKTKTCFYTVAYEYNVRFECAERWIILPSFLLFLVFMLNWAKSLSHKETQRLHREKRSHEFNFFVGSANEVNEENGGKGGRSSMPDTHPDRQMIKRTENKGSQNSSYAVVLLNGFFSVRAVC